jgi:hypothetical protein
VALAELAPVIPLGPAVSGEDELARLRRAVDLPRLMAVGYDGWPGASRTYPSLRGRTCVVIAM